jgi:hypothetical protein
VSLCLTTYGVDPPLRVAASRPPVRYREWAMLAGRSVSVLRLFDVEVFTNIVGDVYVTSLNQVS